MSRREPLHRAMDRREMAELRADERPTLREALLGAVLVLIPVLGAAALVAVLILAASGWGS